MLGCSVLTNLSMATAFSTRYILCGVWYISACENGGRNEFNVLTLGTVFITFTTCLSQRVYIVRANMVVI